MLIGRGQCSSKMYSIVVLLTLNIVLFTFPWHQRLISKIDVHRRSFPKFFRRFLNRTWFKDFRRFWKFSPRLTKIVGLKIPKLTRSVPKKNHVNREFPNLTVPNGYYSWQNPKKLVWKCASRNFVAYTILQLSTFSGILEENLKDPVTLQRQVVNRITTSVKPMSLWSPVDNNSSMNPSAVEATARWQTAHGKLKIRAIIILTAIASNPSW